jgi:hypothetical protein
MLVLVSAAKQPARRDAASGTYILEYPSLFRMLGLFCCIVMPLLLIILVIVIPFKNPEDPYAAGGMFALFFLLGLVLYLESKSRIEFDQKNLSAWSPWRGARSISWGDVADVRYSAGSQYFTVTSGNGTKIRIHSMMRGINDFRDMLNRRVDDEKLAHVKPFLSGASK